jgi:hypothetical protein
MNLESPVVGSAYQELVRKTQSRGGPHRRHAWQQPPTSNDEVFHFPTHEYEYDNKQERDHCMSVMQREMQIFKFARRGSANRLP